MIMTIRINLGSDRDYYFGQPRLVGTDPDTGERIERGKTFTKCTLSGRGALPIDDAIPEADVMMRTYLAAKQPWNAVAAMLTKADLLANRDNRGDRAEAYRILSKIIVLSGSDAVAKARGIKELGITAEELKAFDPKLVEHPEVNEAQAYVAIAELALKQLNDNQRPVIAIDEAIRHCQEARNKLEKMKAEEKDFFSISKSYIIEAKLRALNGEADSVVTGLLEKARIKWPDIEKFIKANPYIAGAKRPDWISASDNVKLTRNGIEYLGAWADVEEARLAAQKVRVPKSQEESFKAEIARMIELCKGAQARLGAIDKSSDYVNHDAIMLQADLTAKLARLNDDENGLKAARELYTAISASAFGNIKALGIAGKISLDIELGEFNWDNLNNILATYFDPADKSSKFSLKAQFDKGSFSYMFIETLEARLRNEAKRTEVVVPGGGAITGGQTPDYVLAKIRASHVKSNINRVLAVRDKDALFDQDARARLELARSIALEAMSKDNMNDKVALFRAAIKELNDILTVVLKENPEDVLGNSKEGKMEGSFYVALWGDMANYLEQIAWLQNTGKIVDMSSFSDAIAKYKETMKLCASSKAKYDRGVSGQSARQKLIQLALDNINTAVTNVDVIAANASAAGDTVKALDALIAKIDKFSVPAEITGVRATKLSANVKRMKLEALCKKLFFINKQPSSYFGGQDKVNRSIDDLYKQINLLAAEILPSLDDTYYPVMNLLGVNAVYMRISPQAAADAIIGLFKTYIQGRKFETTYDMVDALANAAVVKKDKGIRGSVVVYLDGLISRTGSAAASKAKAYVWRARMKSWFYDPKGDVSNSDPKILSGAVADYDSALKIYRTILTERMKLFENGASALAVMEERASGLFTYVNDTLKEDASVPEKISRYQQIAKDIAVILGGETDKDGLSSETVVKVEKQDKAARIKARLTLISMTTALSEPMAKGLVSQAAASDICGRQITGEKDLFAQAEDMFQGALADMGSMVGMTDSEMLTMGVSVPTVYARMAENYMTLQLKATEPLREIDDAVALRDQMQELKAKIEAAIQRGGGVVPVEDLRANIGVLSGALAKLAPSLERALPKRNGITQRANSYYRNMIKYLDTALNKAIAANDKIAQAKVILVKARYAGWTAGDEVEGFDQARSLYKEVLRTNSDVMDIKARLDYANVLSVLSFKNNDSKAATEATRIYEEVKTADDGILGAKACIELANLIAASAGEDRGQLDKARQNIYEALARLTGSKRQDTAAYIDLVRAMKVNDKAVIQALCYLGIIEGRLYTSTSNTRERMQKYANIKALLGGIFGVVRPYEGDSSLAIVMKEFKFYQDAVELSYADAGGNKNSPEYIKAKSRKMD